MYLHSQFISIENNNLSPRIRRMNKADLIGMVIEANELKNRVYLFLSYRNTAYSEKKAEKVKWRWDFSGQHL